MEYFEIEKDNDKQKINKTHIKGKKDKNCNLGYLIGFIVLLIGIILIIYNNLPEKNKKISKESNDKNNKIAEEKSKNNTNIEENKTEDKYNLESIKNEPNLFTQYILSLFRNANNLDLTIFNKNLNKIKQKIYYIIKNKKENEDLYIILSTIYGAFLADSMGSFCEFKSFNKNNHLSIFNINSNRIFKPGQVTDDSEMAMSQAYAIMDNSNYKTLNKHLIYYYYLIWYNSHPLDIGMTTRNALNIINLDNKINITNKYIFSEEIKNYVSRKNYASLANGLLMRISPLLTWFYITNKYYIKEILESKSYDKFYELYNTILKEVEKDSQLTHPNRENAVAGSIFIFMGICAMEQKYSGKEILEMIKILFKHNDFNQLKEEKILKNHFDSILNDFEKNDFNEDAYFGDLSNLMGYYLHAFKLTLYYLYNFEKMKKTINVKHLYNNIMFSICDFGGDTDTNAAIVGMIIGPLIGLQNFNNEYFETFLNFYSKDRIIYTNAFMYFYANYLINIEKNTSITENKVNFNFYKMIYDMLNKEL